MTNVYGPRMVWAIRIAAAGVWFFFGFVLKVLGAEPRHEAIVAAVLGSAVAGPATVLVGLGEIVLGVWVLSGWRPRICAAAQTAAILAMNTLELIFAQELLLSPIGMVLANTLFLSAVWYAALRSPQPSAPVAASTS
ncbi:MAG: DoxX-like family protein [Verrucomicrobiota bacterium]